MSSLEGGLGGVRRGEHRDGGVRRVVSVLGQADQAVQRLIGPVGEERRLAEGPLRGGAEQAQSLTP
ncbi:hypothetical protein [Streptomyces canus]|uniref:hypothetical protein n=1 Tax=Streptomyces canus TaxID=58343 RepID=UPI0036E39363